MRKNVHVLPAIAAAPRPVAPRFWAKVQRGKPDECWPWLGCTTTWGYGSFKVGQKSFIASRVAYAVSHGEEPGDKLVCHTCDNPACCNPTHLWLGTDADNGRDKDLKGRAVHNGIKGEKHMWSKLTTAQVLEVKTSPLTGKALAAKFGVCKTTISEIRQGRNWAWLNPSALWQSEFMAKSGLAA